MTKSNLTLILLIANNLISSQAKQLNFFIIQNGLNFVSKITQSLARTSANR